MLMADTNQDGAIAERYAYSAYGETLILAPDGSTPRAVSAYGNPYTFTGRRLDNETNLMYYRGRYYLPPLGRFIGRDPVESSINVYEYCASSPIILLDPTGEDWAWWLGLGNAQNARRVAIDAITGAAEWVFNQIEKYQGHLTPGRIAAINKVIGPMKALAAKYANQNPETMTWFDLGIYWLFELGAGNSIKFGQNAVTTKDLMKHEGVNAARKKAKEHCETMPPNTGWIVEHTYVFGVKQAFKTIKIKDWTAAFLGSYHTEVYIERQGPNQENKCPCIYEFTVSNTSGWESATRYRKGIKPGAPHRGILQDRERDGPGIALGGNLKEEWKWKEGEE
jgi:RHS repeat-associated protein